MSYQPTGHPPTYYNESPAEPLPPSIAPRPRYLTPGLANLAFFLALVGFLGLSILAELSKWGFFATEVLGEGILAVVAILFCLIGRFNFKDTFSLRRLDIFTIFLCILAGLAGQFAVRFPAALNQWIMQVFGPFPVDSIIPTPKDLPGRVLLFFIVVIVAPLCEETLNRGVVLAGYRRLGFGKSIFYVGLLFGLFHLYPFRFAYTFLLGMVLAYLVLTTGSILSSISAHFGFNLLGGLSPWLLDWLNNFLKDSGRGLVEGESVLDFQAVVSTIPLSLFAAALFFLLIRAISRRSARRRPEVELGYFGLTRTVHPAPPSVAESALTGPYYGPDRRYVYGKYGYTRSGLSYSSSPVMGYAKAGQVIPGWAWPAPVNRLEFPTLEKSWWRLSFIPILLFYTFTAYTEIARRTSYSSTSLPGSAAPSLTVQAPPGEVEFQILQNR